MIATSIEQIPNISCFDDSPRGRLLRGLPIYFTSKAMTKRLYVNLLNLLEFNREVYFITLKVKMTSSLM